MLCVTELREGSNMGSYYMKANLKWPRYYKQMSADHWCHGDNGGSL